ncbi:ATP-binding protein [Actinopolymorpha alba]|uniref:ATP-binding protein n=1 Tax=Actinopolymorpha alba TaxID=533267 RepID=UPI00035D9D0D|nr:BTAD domain-containing putative transcriptional regulator [Actinopolymorpha alba]
MTIELALLSRVAYAGQEITGPRLRGLFALLAGDLRTGCSTSRLVEGLWPDEQPDNPTRALQVLVSRARAQVGAEVIASTARGYRLALRDDQVDTSAIQLSASASAQHARAGDHEAALAHAEAGLALWEGATIDDADLHDPVAALRAERASAYRFLVRARALALARLGRHEEATGPLADLVREHPRDEEVLLELLRCEAATVGPAAALTRYDAYRRALRDELGTDPGPAVQATYQQLLRGEAPVVRHRIPYEPNPLLGRDGDVAEVAKLVGSSRVTSIVGAGGLGKTRLAYAVSRQAEQRVVHIVALAGVTNDEDVTGEVASVLGVGEGWPVARATPRDAVRAIVEALGSSPTLLVLDNCEHVLTGAVELVRTLVSMTDNVRVLTTSRAPLGLSSESVYPLPELDLPTTVELFVQRARAARPGVELPADVVENLCRHLDGLPLAAELAAARVRVMSVAEIARRLGDRFALLRGGARDAPQRHQTLHAVVDWSWNLLEPSARTVMRTLSIFPGGFTPDAARHLLGEGDVLPALEHLVDQSLLKVADTPSGTRMWMLETVREFSTAHREEAGDTDQVIDGFLTWARAFGTAHHDALFSPDPFEPIARIRAEQDNLIQALRHALARADGPSTAATSAALAGLLASEGNYLRLGALADEAGWLLSHYRPEPEFVEVTRTTLTQFVAFDLLIRGPRAVRPLVALRRLPPAPPNTLAGSAEVLLNVPAGDRGALQALAENDQPLVAAAANVLLSYSWEAEADLERALAAARRMLEALKDLEIPWLRGLTHSRISELSLQAEPAGEEARHHLMAALPVLEKMGSWSDLDGIRWWLALANIQRGELDEAERWMEQASGAQGSEKPGALGYDLGVRAEFLLARGEVEAGLRMWRRVVDLARNLNDRSPLLEPADLDPWAIEAEAVCVVAHAQHGRLALVESITAELPERLSSMLAHPVPNPPPYLMEGPLWGALLLALAMVDLYTAVRTGDGRATRSGVRLVALAERFRFLRYFRPTMSVARVRQAAVEADQSAYEEAVSSYANLSRDELRAAALDVLRDRGAWE